MFMPLFGASQVSHGAQVDSTHASRQLVGCLDQLTMQLKAHIDLSST
jgi:hypothetical protein